MNKKELISFYNSNKDMEIKLKSWGFEERMKLKDLFELFKLMMEKEK